MPELVPVRVRDCACPDLPHAEEGDVVYLAPRLSTMGGIAATTELQNAGEDTAMLTARLFVTFIRYGLPVAEPQAQAPERLYESSTATAPTAAE